MQAPLADSDHLAVTSEDYAADDDLIHRYNSQLPPSYRAALDTEHKLLYRALHVLVDAITSTTSNPQQINPTPSDSRDEHVSEGYQYEIERDFAALEKAIGRYLDLKHPLQPSDYPLLFSVLIRGSLTPNMDFGLRSKLARSCVRLLTKRQCVLPQGIPWRRVVEQIVDFHIRSVDGVAVIGRDVRESNCRNFLSLLSKCRHFLLPEDNAEMVWKHFLPGLRSTDPDVQFTQILLMCNVLPTAGDSWSDWVPEGMELWQRLDSSTDWDAIWMTLVGRLSRHQPCVLDWSSYLPWIYTRIEASCNLPLGVSLPQGSADRRCPMHTSFLMDYSVIPMAARFIVYSLSPKYPAALHFLRRFVALIANYFHPSNAGRWSGILGSLVARLTSSLLSRVTDERLATKAGKMDRVFSSTEVKGVAPAEHRLNDEYIDALIELFFPLIELGLHSKVHAMAVQAAPSARDLAIISPAKLIPTMLEKSMEGLLSISSPHRTIAALRLLSTLTPVFLDPEVFPSGSDYLPQALELTLPGIDPNDPGKTESTLRFIAGSAARMQSNMNSERMPISEEFLEGYVHQFLDRIFSLLDSLEAPPKKISGGYGGQQLSYFIFSVAVENLFVSLPKPVAVSAARIVAKQLTCAACTNAMKFYGALVRIAASTAASALKGSSVDIFIPLLTEQLLEKADEKDSAPYTLVSVGEDEVVWRIRMLAQACRSIGTGIEPHLDRIMWVIRLAFDKPTRPIYKAGGRLLRGVLEGLTSIQMKFDVGGGSAFTTRKSTDDELCDFEWREPTKEEWRVAEAFLLKFVELAEEMCPISDKSDADEIATHRDVLFRVLRMLHAAQRGGRWLLGGALPAHFRELDKYIDSGAPLSKTDAKLILKRPVVAGLGGERRDTEAQEFATTTWIRIYVFAFKILKVVSLKRPDDGALLYRCLEPLELAHEPFRCGIRSRQTLDASRSYKSAYRPVVASKRPFGSEGGVGRAMPRFIVKLRVEAHHELRLTIAARCGLDARPLIEEIMGEVSMLALNDFPRVRAEARGVLTRTLRIVKPAVRRHEVCTLISLLRSAVNSGEKAAAKDIGGDIVMSESLKSKSEGSDDMEVEGAKEKPKDDVLNEKLIGAASVLRSSAVSPLIMRDSGLFTNMVHALLDAMPKAERPDAAASVMGLFGKLFAIVRPMGVDPIRLVDKDLVTVPSIKRSEAEELAMTQKLKEYNDMNEYLLSHVETEAASGSNKMTNGTVNNSTSKGEAHWRVQSLVAVLLYVLIREDRAPSAKVVQFFARCIASDVVALRHICCRALALILALHGRKSGVAHPKGDTFDDTPKAWAAAGNAAMSSLGDIVCSEGFARTVVHTLALDHDDDSGDGGYRNGGGLFAILTCSSRIGDGEACWSLMGGRPWPTSWTPRSRDTLNLVHVRFYESLVRVFGKTMFDALMPCIRTMIEKLEAKEEKIIDGVKDEDVRVLAAEVLAGICRGLDLHHCGDGELERNLFEACKRLLDGMSGPTGNIDGATFIRLVGTAEKFAIGGRIMDGILKWQLEGKPVIVKMGNGTLAHLQSRRLRFIHSCVADIADVGDARLEMVTREGVEDLVGEVGFNHELKTVREEVGRLLSLLGVYVSPKDEALFAKAMMTLYTRLGSRSNVEIVDVAENGAVDADGDEEMDDEDGRRKSRSRQGETLSRFVSILYWNGRARMFEKYIAKILPALFESFDESDMERISHAKMALSLAAQGVFSTQTIDDMLDEVMKTAKDRRWKVRASVLGFVQLFSFCSLFTANDSSLARIRSVVLSLLSDSQLEVRQAAAASFVTMIRDAEEGVVDEVRKGCLKVLKETAPKRRGGKRVPVEGDLVYQRHGSVLALSSMVTSCPYSVPQWMPSVLVALSSCVNDAPPICTGVRELFGDFMRTHRDEWPVHRQKFSPDELEIIQELLVSPSYYA